MTTAVRQCHKQAEFVTRIQRALGVSLQGVQCRTVNTQGMTQVMQRAGWSANGTQGVVGFQFKNDVYVLDSTPWTVLHELIHRAGVNADRLSRFVAEGLTEAIAVELKRSPDEHRATYPQETKWVREVLLPRLNLTAVELGRKVAKSNDPPRMLAALMVKARPSVSMATLERELQPQSKERPSFNRGKVTRAMLGGSESTATGSVAALLLHSGFALGIPLLMRRTGGVV